MRTFHGIEISEHSIFHSIKLYTVSLRTNSEASFGMLYVGFWLAE